MDEGQLSLNSSSNTTPATRPSGNVTLTPPDKTMVEMAPQFWQIRNNGTTADTYVISAIPADAAKIMPSRVTVPPAEARYFTVFPQGWSGNTTIIANSTTYQNDSYSITTAI